MTMRPAARLNHKQHYLQVALNSSLLDAQQIINSLPVSDRILIEAGTPLIKQYGVAGIQQIQNWWQQRLWQAAGLQADPYIVADLKCMDRARTEVALAYQGGASAAVVLGRAPIETTNEFVKACADYGIDSMIDMMSVDKPYQILRQLEILPTVVILHRGVDETELGNKPLPIHMINKVKGAFDVMISIAGGDTSREVQSAVFNGANIVVLWKNFYTLSADTPQIAQDFLQQIK